MDIIKKQQRQKLWLFLIITILLFFTLSACGEKDIEIPESAQSTITASLTLPPTLTATSTSTFTLTFTPTNTLTPTYTSTLTSTPTPTFYAVVIVDYAIVRSGPATNYPEIANVTKGTELDVVGRSTDEFWAMVKLAFNLQGWVAINSIELTGSVSDLPDIESPSTPIPSIPPPLVLIVPYSAKAGETRQVTIRNFLPNEELVMEVRSASNGNFVARLSTRTANANGEVHWAFHVFSSWDTGVYILVVTGSSGNYAQGYFEVTN